MWTTSKDNFWPVADFLGQINGFKISNSNSKWGFLLLSMCKASYDCMVLVFKFAFHSQMMNKNPADRCFVWLLRLYARKRNVQFGPVLRVTTKNCDWIEKSKYCSKFHNFEPKWLMDKYGNAIDWDWMLLKYSFDFIKFTQNQC